MNVELNKDSDLVKKTFGETILTDSTTVLMITPPIGEDYWVARVHLHRDQYLLAFPKFFTIGVGFAKEKDWNTNLPYKTSADALCDHIYHNHKYKAITREMTIEAIKLLQPVCAQLIATSLGKQQKPEVPK